MATLYGPPTSKTYTTSWGITAQSAVPVGADHCITPFG